MVRLARPQKVCSEFALTALVPDTPAPKPLWNPISVLLQGDSPRIFLQSEKVAMKSVDCVSIDLEHAIHRFYALNLVFPEAQDGARVKFCALGDIPPGISHISHVHDVEIWDHEPLVILELQVELAAMALTARINAARVMANSLNNWAKDADLGRAI